MHALVESTASYAGSGDRHCPVTHTRVDRSFCRHVCSHHDDCVYHVTHSPYLTQNVDALTPLTTADLSQLTWLGINPLQPKGQNLNYIQDRFLHNPQWTKQQVHALRTIPWIQHQSEGEWPVCDCLACCGALIITVIENATVMK